MDTLQGSSNHSVQSRVPLHLCHSFTPNENLHIRTRYAEMLSPFSVTADIHGRAGVPTFIRTMFKKQRDFSIVLLLLIPAQANYSSALLFLSFPWLMMEVSPCWRDLPSPKWKIKSSSAAIVSALASVLSWRLIMLLLRDNLLLKQQLYLLLWKKFLYPENNSNVLKCRHSIFFFIPSVQVMFD